MEDTKQGSFDVAQQSVDPLYMLLKLFQEHFLRLHLITPQEIVDFGASEVAANIFHEHYELFFNNLLKAGCCAT
jgi:hypothetical protein